MAGVLPRCTVFSLPSRPGKATASLSQPLPQPPIATSAHKPSKLVKRRNHLRPKILKTLAKPYAPVRTPEEPPSDAVIPVPSSEALRDLVKAESPGEEASHVSESVGVGPEHGSAAGKLSARSVIKFGAYLVVVFLFQTICAVWVFGSTGSDSAGERKERTLVNGKGEGRALSGKFSSSTRNVVYLDESDLEKRIEEIRLMAREARRSEKRGLKRDDTGDGESDDGHDDDGDAIPESRTAIEKEIGSRLDKLQKKLGPVRKSPGLSKNVPLEGASSLMFKKKLKFRSPSVEKPSANPKGFQWLQDNGKTKKKSSSEVNVEGQSGGLNHGVAESSNGEKWEELVDGKRHGSLSKDIKRESDETMVFTEMLNDLHDDGVGEGQSFPREDEEVGDTRSRTGIVDEASGKRNSVGGANLRTTGNFGLQSFRNLGEEKQEATRSAGRDVNSINGTLKHEEIKAASLSKRVKDKQLHKNEQFWWLKLPCVFAILMRRGSDLEEPGGFFTLKTAPVDTDASSYTVAFEDRIDANNFCILLESFFEELGDFSADIVPLLRKELQEAMKENTMKMVVVRKGQLKLYAGQPFSDVELALQSLVEESLRE